MQTLLDKIRRFNAERDWQQFHSPKNLAMALAVEAAELLEQFQWLTQEQSRHPDPARCRRISEEIADVMIFLLNLADQLGIDPLRAATAKLDQNAAKYPVALARGRSAKYDALPQNKDGCD